MERIKRAGKKIAEEVQAENQDQNLFDEGQKQVPDIGFKVFDCTPKNKLEVDEAGQVTIQENSLDAMSRIYNMIFTVGIDAPTQVPEQVKENCIYKIGNHYYITNSNDIHSNQLAEIIKQGKVFIDGWTASLSATLLSYKSDVNIVF